MNDIALVCIAKDEDFYLQEWIDYHLKLGFDAIHIYQNNWRFSNPIKNSKVYFHEWDYNTKTKLIKDNWGNYIASDEPLWEFNLQSKCYTQFAINYHTKYRWAAFFDVDEFLVLKETDNIKDFIKNYEEYNCLIINWSMFGDNGIKDFDPNYTGVIERFTKRWDKPHKENLYMFKSICKLHKEMKHMIHSDGGEWVDPNYNVGNGLKNFNYSYDKAQLNHYYTKTYDEWRIKIKKNDKDMKTVSLESFNDYNHNDVEDLNALNFMKQ